MATINVTTQKSLRSGLEAVYTALNDTDTYTVQNNGSVILHVKNTDVSDATISIVTPSLVDGLAIADRDVVITAGEERFIGVFPKTIYNDSAGKITFTCDLASNVEAAAISI